MDKITQEAISTALRTVFILGKEAWQAESAQEREKLYGDYCQAMDRLDSLQRENNDLRKKIEDTGVANQERNFTPEQENTTIAQFKDLGVSLNPESLKTHHDFIERLKNGVKGMLDNPVDKGEDEKNRNRKTISPTPGAKYVCGHFHGNEEFTGILGTTSANCFFFTALIVRRSDGHYEITVHCPSYPWEGYIRKTKLISVYVQHERIVYYRSDEGGYRKAQEHEKNYITEQLAEYGFRLEHDGLILCNQWD